VKLASIACMFVALYIMAQSAPAPVTCATLTVDGQPVCNTATILTKLTQMSGACGYLNSTNGTTGYTYDLGSVCQALLVYTKGMRFWLTTDVPCPANCSINVSQVGLVSIKRSDGATDPGGQYDFTQGVPIWYDGTVFRLEWQH
jgi:hypothetical protein